MTHEICHRYSILFRISDSLNYEQEKSINSAIHYEMSIQNHEHNYFGISKRHYFYSI